MPPVLTTASQIQCMHGGFVVLSTSNSNLQAGGSFVLLETDVHVVIGCPFTNGVTYTPCLTVEWEAPAEGLAVGIVGVLTIASIGNCLNAAGAPQGIAIVSKPAPELEAV